MKQKKKKNKNCRLKKTKFFKSANSQYIFTKISVIGPWLVEQIDAKGKNVAQAIWLSGCLLSASRRDINSKKSIFSPFLSLHWTAI